jgi:TfoX/Sxy family transcriptional regulator of competence genes
MPFSEKLANRIRESLSDLPKVEEKMMFRGLCFMVNDKMCICVSDDELMCRVGPEAYSEALEKDGVRPMIHNGKTMTGFVFVGEDVVKSKKNLDYWVTTCLAFNKEAKASKKKNTAGKARKGPSKKQSKKA